MYHVTIDCVSVKEIDALCTATGKDLWDGVSFDSIKEAEDFACICKEISPLAQIEVVL